MKTKYPRNINHGYAYTFFSYFGITGLWVMYLQTQGLSLVEIGLCESIFHIASFIFEVPTGVLADRFTYRSVLIMGRISAILSAIVILLGHSFWWFAIGFVLSALSYNLQSGTIDALMYDSLIKSKQTNVFPKIISNVNVIIEFGDTVGVVIAGFFVHWHFGLTYVISILIGFLGLVTVLLMNEPQLNTSLNEPHQTIKSIAVTAYQTLSHNRQLRGLMLFQAFFTGICTTYYYYFQSLMSKNHFSSILISSLLIVSAIVNIIGIKLTPTIQKQFSKRKLLTSLSFCLTILLLTSWLNLLPLLITLFLVSQLLGSLVEPIFSSYYNDLIDSQQRATLLSVASVLFSVSMIALFPAMGWLIQTHNFSFAFGSVGIILLIVLTMMFHNLRLTNHN